MSQYKKEMFLGFSLLFLSVLLLFSYSRQKDEELAARLAPGILRFHVLANSNQKQDQNLKLKVKSKLLDKIYEENSPASTKAELCSYLADNKERLEDYAEDCMASLGYDYSACLDLGKSYFPEKIYGDIRFPCGTYDAARLIIGKGKGRNWWCVLYPSLCFVNESFAVVPDSSKEKLEALLEEEDYAALMESGTENITLRCRFRIPEKIADLFSGTFSDPCSGTYSPASSARP